MKNVLYVVGMLVAGALLAVLLLAGGKAFTGWRETRARRVASKDQRRPPETMKLVVWACVVNGFAWVWCSYILAALDKPQIAEELSKVALVEIIAPVFAYAAKSAVENLSKNNRWPDKGYTREDAPPEETGGEGGAG